jgi:hypothetical protein
VAAAFAFCVGYCKLFTLLPFVPKTIAAITPPINNNAKIDQSHHGQQWQHLLQQLSD